MLVDENVAVPVCKVVEPNVAAPVTPKPPVTFKLFARLAAPVTAKVELNVAAPVTPSVDPRVVAPVTPRPPVILTFPDALTVDTEATPVIPTVDPKVAAPVTPRPPVILALDATCNVPPTHAFPVTPRPPCITTAAEVVEVAFNELPIIYAPSKVFLNDGAPPEVSVVNMAPTAVEAAVTATGETPLPYTTPFDVNADVPVPPLITGSTPVTPVPDKDTEPNIGAELFP